MSFAPARRAVTAFCFTPPTGPTDPSSLIAPVIATFLPPVRLPGVSWSMIASVNASPADGPLTRWRVDVDGQWDLMPHVLLREDPRVRHALALAVGGLDVVLAQLHLHVETLAVTQHREHCDIARLVCDDRRADVLGGGDRLTVDGDDLIAELELAVRRPAADDVDDLHGARIALHRVSEPPQRDRLRGLLRLVHLVDGEPVALGVPRARR